MKIQTTPNKCYEFHLADGTSVKLKPLSSNMWQMDDCSIVTGDLNDVIGSPFLRYNEIECWSCDN